ncbi:MAG: hypothetical protein AAF212_05835 [Verrucomicrobiota bacterium]
MRKSFLITIFLAVCCVGAIQPPIRLKSIVAIGDKTMCSLENTKTKKSYWLDLNEKLPELEGYFISHINIKNNWIELKKQENSYIIAISGMYTRAGRKEMSIEESGLSSMIAVYENRNRK